MRTRVWLALSAGLLAACDPEIASERGDFALAFPGLHSRMLGRWPAPHLVVEGTVLCPVLRCQACPEGQDCSDAAIAAAGPVAADGAGCFVADAPGEVVWTVAAPCGQDGQEPDRATMRVVGADAVRAVAVRAHDQLVAGEAGAVTVGPGWEPLPDWPLRVVEGAQVVFAVDLLEEATDHFVAWSEGAVEWTTTRGRPPVVYPSGALELVTFAGSEAEASFGLAARTWPLGPVLGVSPAEAATLELAAAIDPPTGSALARAVARDADGRLLDGLPVTWSVDDRALALDPQTIGPDYIWLSDNCVPPEARGGPREAVVRARGGDLQASATLRWNGVAGEPDPDWAPPDSCIPAGGCDCASAPPRSCDCASAPTGGAGLLGTLAWLLARRRRRDASMNPRVRSSREPAPAENVSPETDPGGPRGATHPDAPRGASGRAASRVMSVGSCLVAALALPACGGDPPALRAEVTRELGALDWDERVSGRDGGYSARVGDRSLWVFGDTVGDKAPGALPGFLNNTACTTPDFDARDGLFPLDEHLDPDGHATEFLPMTPDEIAHELEHGGEGCDDACEGIAMWPGPVIHDPDRGRVLVFYAKLLQRPGPLNITMLGTSIAVWDDSLPLYAERPIVAEGSPEPSLLFPDGGPELAAAALAEDDRLFAYYCNGDGFDKPCRLARAPLADPLTRESWEFYAGKGRWSADHERAEVLFDGAPMMTVHRKDDIGAYVAVYAEPASTDIVLRTAPALTGPWSDAEVFHRPQMPAADLSVYGALLHPELARDGGRVDYLTYFIGETGTMQLVEVAWQ